MKTFLLVFLIMLINISLALGQTTVDSLQTALSKHTKQDTNRVNLLTELAYQLQSTGSDESLAIAMQALKLSQTLKFAKGEVTSLRRIGGYYYQRADYPSALKYFNLNKNLAARVGDSTALGWAYNGIGTVFHSKSDYPQALQNYLLAVKTFEKIGKKKEAASIMGNAAVLYKEIGELAEALKYYRQGLKIQEEKGDKNEIARFLNNIGGIYSDQNKFPQAEKAFIKSLSLAEAEKNIRLMALVLRNLLETKVLQKNYPLAFKYGFRSYSLYQSLEEKEGIADVSFQLATAYLNSGKPDSALYYAEKSLKLSQETGFIRNIHNTYNVLAEAYGAKENFQKAFEAQRKYIAYKDSLTGEDQQNLVASLKFKYELDKKQSQIEVLNKDRQLRLEEAKHQRQQMYASIIGLILITSMALILIRNNRQQQNVNRQLKEQKEEIQQTLTELKLTQAQLVQREKMASLGELTAGIAHEIQNPLNFVNNFSQLSIELLEELKVDLISKLPSKDKEEADDIIGNITLNLDKILHHGKRADGIVKGMLQHSKSNTGYKELTDLNALANEFLQLSYNSLQAKEKSFKANMQTSFDPDLERIKIIPQDLGRVFINLFSNALYSVSKKMKEESGDYYPTVVVSTKRNEKSVEIKVWDNGTGIAKQDIDKIFQPFFTTKPTGQGTGLGLSISYDIVHKIFNGHLRVNTQENEFAEFVIELPMPKKVIRAKDVSLEV
ncbi:MAG: hypothetical protein JWN56_1902 [Sphingobacteriales bacterium]|nr:hypothetical protein [Sphingobacteriales bacterium]